MIKSNSMTVSIVVPSYFVFAFVLSPILCRWELVLSFCLHFYLLAVLSLILYLLLGTGETHFKLSWEGGFQAICICLPLTVALFKG